MTGIHAILGLVMLFALGGQVSLALAMREYIKHHNFGCNTESRVVFSCPAHAPKSVNLTMREHFNPILLPELDATNSGNISRDIVADNDSHVVGTFPLHTCLFSFLRTMLGVA